MPGARLLLPYPLGMKGLSPRKNLLLAVTSALAAFYLQACTNRAVNKTSATQSASNSISVGSSSISNPFRLSRVLRSQADPGGQFDLIGDGSGALQNYCNPTNGDPTEAGLCQCVYSYIEPSGSSFVVAVDPVHIESDLIRCPYSVIPPDVTQVQTRLYFVPADLYSNTYLFQFSLDVPASSLADISNYVKPLRFQCKSHVYISHMGDSSDGGGGNLITTVYDPIQSEDPALAYGFNFFTSNAGGAVALYSSQPDSSQKLWECPGDLTAGSPLGLDYTLFSRKTDGQSSRIYPPVGSVFDRSTFFVAKKKVGLFTMPINAPLMPGVANSLPDINGNVAPGLAPVLGWGVPPVPAAGGENCPGSNVAIPSGYHWAKLWLFRASMPVRYAIDSPLIRNTVVTCSPGTWASDPSVPLVNNTPGNFIPLYPDCADRVAGRGCLDTGCSTMENTNGSQLVDRILLIPTAGNNPAAARCVKLGTGSNSALRAGFSTLSDASGLAAPFINANYPLGSDAWYFRDYVSYQQSCGPQTADILNLCKRPTASGEINIPDQIPHHSGTAPSPLPRMAIDQNSDGSGFSSRFDYVFVVTPTSISKRQMEEASADLSDNHPALPYIPYRFLPASACNSTDPSNAPPGDCLPQNKLFYQIKLHDMTLNSDNPSSEGAQRNVTFPVCVLQPN